jgi:hypothetical protein
MEFVMKSNLFLFLFVVSIFQFCSSWKKSELPHVVSWSDTSNELLVYKIVFEEKESWNPMMGTTDKSNYTTFLKILQYEPSRSAFTLLMDKQIGTWVLPYNVFWKSGANEIFLIMGSDKDGYGTENRRIAIYNRSTDQLETIWESEQGRYLWRIVPSPDYKSIAFITSESAASTKRPELHIWQDKKIISANLKSWLDSPVFGISWEKNSKSLFVRRDSEVEKVEIRPESLVFSKSTLFPDCFFPGTSFGSSISPNKKELQMIDFFNISTYKLVDQPSFVYYSDVPRVSKFSGKDCF